MTQDQLKDLKEDDEMLILAEVHNIRKDGNVGIRYPFRGCNGEIIWGAISLACVQGMTISGHSEWAQLAACFACSFIVGLIAAAKF